MADAIISVVLEQLASYVQEEIGLVVGVREEVRKLTITLNMIRGVLADAERRQVKETAVKTWLEELKNIFYAADDVLDEWHTISQQPQLQGDTPPSKKVLLNLFSPCFCFKHAVVRYDISHRIQDISKNLDALAQQRLQYGLNVIQADVLSSEWQARPLTSSIANLLEIHGRDHEKGIIISRLIGGSSHQENDIPVISLVGMGGFGKTTLARLVFNDDSVQNNFEVKIWVCVSEPFDLIRVARTIIEQVTRNSPDVNEWEALHQHLCDSIKGKKFLLILDDVWTRNSDHWDPLKHSLDGGALGSRIILTTRDHGVASMMASSYIHDIPKLSDEDCWLLLKDIALRGRQEVVENFEKIGREIAMKCKGVPLAVKILAGHLCSQKTKQQWVHALSSDFWGVGEIEQKFLPSLLLSYHSLPSNIKQCFIYCAIFPKDTILRKGDLVKLWMAQGFLGSDGMKELERIGENYFDRLATCSFFEDLEEKYGNVIQCKMHDLVHDFSQSLAQKECSYLEKNDKEFDANKIRHICVKNFDDSVIFKAKNLRTFMSHNCRVPDLLFDKLARLRTLDLENTKLKELAKEVGMLLHLRYLRLKSSDLLELPETICNLYNLQSLILNGCRRLRKLPNGIGKLKNLRHLEIEWTRNLRYMPSGIGGLSSLRTLTMFIVGGSSSSDLEGCKISDLKSLNNLGGCLEIQGLKQVSDVNEATKAEMKKKINIRKLILNYVGDGLEASAMEKDVLERLEPHENLECLIVRNYPDSHFPLWMENTSTLANLTELELYYCCGCTELPALDKLESLQKLEVVELGSVKNIKHEFPNNGVIFPKLRVLVFEGMLEWEEWSIPLERDGGVIFPELKHLRLTTCPKLKLSLDFINFKSLETLILNGLRSWEEWSIPLERDDGVIFPELKYLKLSDCPKLKLSLDFRNFKSLETLKLKGLESWEGSHKNEEEDGCSTSSSMGYLKQLEITKCKKLKVIPHYMFPDTLRELRIQKCPELKRGMQPCVPPLLEKMVLWGDTSVFPGSLQQCSLSLKGLTFWIWKHSSMPKHFNQLKVLESLIFYKCETLDFELQELKHFTTLRSLWIHQCPLLEQRFLSSGENQWRSFLSHVPYITINDHIVAAHI